MARIHRKQSMKTIICTSGQDNMFLDFDLSLVRPQPQSQIFPDSGIDRQTRP